MKKRNILTVALALCLIAIMACGSLAYFTNTKTVTNVFMTSTIPPKDEDGDGELDEPTADDVFSITLTEPNAKNDATETNEGYEYANILPGDELDKDPTVTNTGAYDAYIRVKVVVNKAFEWQNAIQKHLDKGNLDEDAEGNYSLENIFKGFDATKWERVTSPEFAEVKDQDEKVVDTTLTYVYYLKEALPAEDNAETAEVQEDAVTLFTDVVIPSCFDAEDMLSLKEFKLDITADAIQSINTGGDAADDVLDSYYAFKEFWKVNNPDTTTP